MNVMVFDMTDMNEVITLTSFAGCCLLGPSNARLYNSRTSARQQRTKQAASSVRDATEEVRGYDPRRWERAFFCLPEDGPDGRQAVKFPHVE